MAVSSRRHEVQQRRQEAQELVERLRGRREEIEQTLLARVHAVADPGEVMDPEYALGLRTAVSAALDYALASLAASEAFEPTLPPELPGQARAAARAGVSLETVLRRYFAGYTLLSDCLVREAQGGGLDLAEAMRSQAELFDRLIAAVTEAYSDETQMRFRSAEWRRAQRVKQLLRGDLIDSTELGYPLDGWHLGVLAAGPAAPEAIHQMARALQSRLLVVRPGGELVWGWLGTRHSTNIGFLLRQSPPYHADTSIALGEPAPGIVGWRATHRQAAAALPIAQHRGGKPVRYGEVALLAASLQDELLADSLRELYLEPLLSEPDGGEALRRTARAYFAANRNISAAAAALRVSRPTVTSRLRMIEERLGRSAGECAAEMETALRLHELTDAAI